MRQILIILSILLSSALCGQNDYYSPQAADSVASQHVMTKAESRAARKQERLARKQERLAQKAGKPKCYCPYAQSTSVWHDVVNDGIVGTGKAIYQSTIKPQVLGEVVGAVQGAANSSPLPTIAATTGVAIATSEVHKARRHQRNRQVPRVERACDCDPCAYHSQRYHPATGTH